MLLGAAAQGVRKAGREDVADGVALEGLDGRPGVVGGQVQQGGRAVEPFAPVVEPAPELLALLPLPLPDGEVGVLEAEFGQFRFLARADGPVALGEFGQEQGDGPGVGDDVVQGGQQDVVSVGQFEQGHAQQWAVLQREGPPRLAGGDPVGLGASAVPVAVLHGDHRHGDLGAGHHGLDESSLVVDDPGPQGLVAGDDVVEGALQHDPVEAAVGLEGGVQVVGRASGGVEFPEEPQPFLAGGGREDEGTGQGVLRAAHRGVPLCDGCGWGHRGEALGRKGVRAARGMTAGGAVAVRA